MEECAYNTQAQIKNIIATVAWQVFTIRTLVSPVCPMSKQMAARISELHILILRRHNHIIFCAGTLEESYLYEKVK